MYVIFFFFSSRRRHTRLTCDWSSDVCSSDLVGEARDVHEPGLALDDQVVTRAVRLRPGLAEARDRAVDEPRVELRQGTVAQAELRHRPGTEVLEEDIALSHERRHDPAPLRRLEVQGDALLAPVDRHEVGGFAL